MTLAAVAIFLFCVDDSVMLILGSIPREARIHGTLVTVAVHLGIGGLWSSSVVLYFQMGFSITLPNICRESLVSSSRVGRYLLALYEVEGGVAPIRAPASRRKEGCHLMSHHLSPLDKD